MDIYNMTWPLVHATGAKKTRFNEDPLFAEGLYKLNENTYAWMVPNGSWGEANAGLIIGESSSMLVDTLWDPHYTKTMLAAMAPYVQQQAISYVVNTHSDGDHCWGNECFPDAEIIATAACATACAHHTPEALLKLYGLGGLLKKLPLRRFKKIGQWLQQMQAPYDFASVNLTLPNVTFSGEKIIDLGDKKVVLKEVGPAHTPGDLLVYVPDDKILFSGDILFIGSTPVIWAGPIANWIKVLDDILAMDVEIIVPGHGPITNKEGVQQVKSYWEFVSAQIKEYYAKGIKYWKAAEAIINSDEFHRLSFANWDSPERMVTNCYTEYRHLQGQTKQQSISEIVKVLLKQAALAYAHPEARPKIMRS